MEFDWIEAGGHGCGGVCDEWGVEPLAVTDSDGAFLLTYRGRERQGAGGIATLWPWRSAFLRIGAEVTPRSDLGDARLLWGAGWDDWRGNTFSLTVHNWGPLRPEDAPVRATLKSYVGNKAWCKHRRIPLQ